MHRKSILTVASAGEVIHRSKRSLLTKQSDADSAQPQEIHQPAATGFPVFLAMACLWSHPKLAEGRNRFTSPLMSFDQNLGLTPLFARGVGKEILRGLGSSNDCQKPPNPFDQLQSHLITSQCRLSQPVDRSLLAHKIGSRNMAGYFQDNSHYQK